jgi:uncharacterized protein
VPLVASSVGTDQLLGGPGSRPAAVDALAARTLVKGEALAPPAGRADDFVWPRREVGREQAKGDSPVANVAPAGTVTPGQKARQQQQQQQQKKQAQPARPVRPAQPVQPAQQPPPAQPAQTDLFGAAPRQAPPPTAAPRPPANVPRPPANVGRSAASW